MKSNIIVTNNNNIENKDVMHSYSKSSPLQQEQRQHLLPTKRSMVSLIIVVTVLTLFLVFCLLKLFHILRQLSSSSSSSSSARRRSITKRSDNNEEEHNNDKNEIKDNSSDDDYDASQYSEHDNCLTVNKHIASNNKEVSNRPLSSSLWTTNARTGNNLIGRYMATSVIYCTYNLGNMCANTYWQCYFYIFNCHGISSIEKNSSMAKNSRSHKKLLAHTV